MTLKVIIGCANAAALDSARHVFDAVCHGKNVDSIDGKVSVGLGVDDVTPDQCARVKAMVGLLNGSKANDCVTTYSVLVVERKPALH